MKRLGMILPIIALMASAAFAQQGPRELAGVADKPERSQAQLQNTIADLYLANFKERVGLSDDQFLRVRPMVRRFIQNRFQVANQRRILEERQAQLLNQSNASEAEIQKLNDDLTSLDEAGAIDGRFMKNLQRELSPRQGALAREFHKQFINERLPLMLERLRAAQADPNRKGERAAARANQQNRKDQAQRPADTLRGKNNSQPAPARKNLAR